MYNILWNNRLRSIFYFTKSIFPWRWLWHLWRRTGGNSSSPGLRFCFHQVSLSQKSPPCSWTLVSIINFNPWLFSLSLSSQLLEYTFLTMTFLLIITRYYVRVSFLIQYSLYKNIACFTGQVTPERANFISCSEQKLQEKNDPMISGFQVFYMFYSNFSAQVSTFHVVLTLLITGRSWTFVWGKRSQM